MLLKEVKMYGNHRHWEAVLSVLILIFAFWQTMYSKWVIVVAAALILLHTAGCGDCCSVEQAAPKKMAKRKKG